MFAKLKNLDLRWRRRSALAIVLAAIVGCFFAAGSVVQTLLERQRESERQSAERAVNELLAHARRFTDGYVQDRLAQREKQARRLTAQATALAGEMQVFLQAAAVNREAKETRGQIQKLEQKRAGLYQLADSQQNTIDDLRLKLATLEAEMQTLRANPYGSPSNGQTNSIDGENSANAENSADASAQTNAANEQNQAAETKEKLRAFTDIAATSPDAQSSQWLENLLQECALDFKNLLPPNSALLVAEVGKQVLLTLGDGEISENEIQQEVSLPLILQENGDSRQLMITLTIVDADAPPLPSPGDLARALAINLSNAGYDLRGFIISEDDDVLAVFPENESGVRPLLPNDRLWISLPNGVAAAYYQTLLTPSASRDYPWLLGLQITVPQTSGVERLSALAGTHPLGAAIFAVACLLLLAAFVVAAALIWNGGTAPSPKQKSTRHYELLEPQLGSLQRLQNANRQRESGSNVLFSAKNPVLRDLTARISPTRVARSSKKLREYRE